MSGIAALLNTSGQPVDEKLVVSMAASMARRGPAKQQCWLNNNVALVHCLLPTTIESINEHQPSTTDNKVWVSANARIDSREEFIKKLQGQNLEVNANTTDDHLIGFAYQLWGIDCLQHMIGDYAFILWDSEHQRLICATDQFGVAPVYYAQTSQGVCISNSLNTIRLHPDVSAELDQQSIGDYLLFRINEDSNSSSFKDIKHLPAGHYLIVEKGKFTIREYWSLSPRDDFHFTSADDYVAEFSELLATAVADRNRVATDLAVHLSGGMDSSSIAALSKQTMLDRGWPQQIQAYTFGPSGTLPDLEGPVAAQIAEHLDIQHHVYSASAASLAYHESPADLHFPEPRFSTRDAPGLNVLKHASTYGSVLLTGFGGDPLLRGHGLDWKDLRSPHNLFHLSVSAIRHYQLFGKRPHLGLRRHRTNKLSDTYQQQLPSWLQSDFAARNNLLERLQWRYEKQNSARNHRAGMQSEGLWRRLFCSNDPGFTQIPVKLAHPFFDVRLLEFSQQLPPFPWQQNKTILRQAMRPLLPNSVVSRPKTIAPGNSLGSILQDSGVSEHFRKLLNNPDLAEYIKTDHFDEKFNAIDLCNKRDFRAIIKAITLSYWLQGYKQVPSTLTINENTNNVRRI